MPRRKTKAERREAHKRYLAGQGNDEQETPLQPGQQVVLNVGGSKKDTFYSGPIGGKQTFLRSSEKGGVEEICVWPQGLQNAGNGMYTAQPDYVTQKTRPPNPRRHNESALKALGFGESE